MKRTFAIACLATVALNAQAATQTYDFVYRGFERVYFFPVHIKSLAGSFSGDDRNGDSILTRDELASFTIGGYDYVNFPNITTGNNQRQGELGSFEFRGGTQLNFSAGFTAFEDGAPLYWEFYDFDKEGTSGYGYEGKYGPPIEWRTTRDTTLSVTSAVPEPSSIAMSLVGLGLVGLMARRRRGETQQH